MDLSILGIPNLRVTHIGPRRSPSEIVRATLHLPAWDGYLVKRWDNGRAITDGTIIVNFACNTRSTREDWEPQLAAYHYLVEHQQEIRDRIAEAVIANISDLIGYLDPADPGVPPITDANADGFDLRPFVGPSSVSILEETKGGMDYVEWFLNCTWDEEHGLAAVTHQSRLIDLDRGETDIYKIFADNGTLEEELKEAEKYKGMRGTKPQRPWWKFW